LSSDFSKKFKKMLIFFFFEGILQVFAFCTFKNNLFCKSSFNFAGFSFRYVFHTVCKTYGKPYGKCGKLLCGYGFFAKNADGTLSCAKGGKAPLKRDLQKDFSS